jgi:carbonic anhydrase
VIKECQTVADYAHGIRTQADAAIPADVALEKLREGNQRYVDGKPLQEVLDATHRKSLAQHGQNPFAAIIGSADSRCPIEILFDVQPGDMFVLRNAGNTSAHSEGSIVASVEYSIGHLNTKLVLVLGHTKCGAIAGATSLAMSGVHNGTDSQSPKKALDKLLEGFAPVALQAAAELGPGASVEEIAAHAVKVNVFHTIENLLKFSAMLREKVSAGDVQVQGGIYDILSGEVEFVGPHPNQLSFLDRDSVGDSESTTDSLTTKEH